ncbi:hypothetical protein AB4Z10_14495, partial [Bosea sp. RAF48]
SMLEAGEFVRTLEARQGLRIACPEEIAYRQGWISNAQLTTLGQKIAKSDYGRYILQIAETGGSRAGSGVAEPAAVEGSEATM